MIDWSNEKQIKELKTAIKKDIKVIIPDEVNTTILKILTKKIADA